MGDKRSSLAHMKQVGPDTWDVRVEAGRDPVTGKRIQISKRVRGSERDADKVKVSLLAQHGRAGSVCSSMTVKALMEDVYLPWAKEHVRANTYTGYERDSRVHIVPVLGAIKLRDLDAQAIEAWLKGIERPSARLDAYKTLRQALRRAVKWQLVESVATDAVDVPKVRKTAPQTAAAEQLSAIMAAIRGTDIEAGVVVSIGCGMRRSEVLGLVWGDFNRDCSEVSVERSYTWTRGEGYLYEPKTERSKRVVSIPPSFASRLMELRGADADAVVPGREPGSRMHPDAFSAAFQRVIKSAGVDRITLKNLRHSHATVMLSAGVPVVDVSRRLGHSNISVTDRFYLAPKRDRDQAAANAFDRLGIC